MTAGDRPGDVRLSFPVGTGAGDAALVFVGRIRSPWPDRDSCPKNLREARQRGQEAMAELDPPWRPGLEGLAGVSHIVLLYWMHDAPRDLIVQAPRHRPQPAGVFALRSPARPNPIAIAVVRLLELDMAAGRLRIDAIDCVDGTALLDIKPWLPGVDVPPGWQPGGQGRAGE